MATAQRASGTPTPGRSARVGRKRDGMPWHSPLTQVIKGALYQVFGWLELPAGYRYTTGLLDFEHARLWDPVADFVKLMVLVFQDFPDARSCASIVRVIQ